MDHDPCENAHHNCGGGPFDDCLFGSDAWCGLIPDSRADARSDSARLGDHERSDG
jgi:hypothetical protein